MSEYTIDAEKLKKVVSIYRAETEPTEDRLVIETAICADWNEGAEHQEWINNASAQEIADWLASFCE